MPLRILSCFAKRIPISTNIFAIMWGACLLQPRADWGLSGFSESEKASGNTHIKVWN